MIRKLFSDEQGRIKKRAEELINSIGFSIDPSLKAGDLSIAQQQIVEIAKALSEHVRVLILDEPSAVLLKYNVFGRIVIAIGSNEEAVRLSGIKVSAYKFSVYAIAGGLSAVAGIITTARTAVGSPVMGVGMELDVIATVVIGGASLNGGKGSGWSVYINDHRIEWHFNCKGYRFHN